MLKETSPEQDVEDTACRNPSETVLIAEDDETLRRMLTQVLEKNGYTVIEAADADDIVQKFNKHQHDIDPALVDMIMPGKNGKEIAEHIKSKKPDVKTLFISAHSSDIITNKGIYDPGDRLLSKPFSPNELLRNIRELLDK